MKGEKGVCSVGIGVNQVRRTKFDSKKHAEASCEFHKGMGFISSDAIVYKCNTCGLWHFGKIEWAEKFGK
jgi:hypothetical protein